MKTLYALILVLLTGTAYGQTDLPECQGTDSTKWSNCFRSWTNLSDQKYIGEYKDGQKHGQGIFTWPDGRGVWIGEWTADRANGRIIRYTHNGAIAHSGIYKFGIYDHAEALDPSAFTRLSKHIAAFIDRQSRLDDQWKASYEQERLRLADGKRKRNDGQTGQWIQTSPSGCKVFTLLDGNIDIEWDGGCSAGLLHGLGSSKLYLDKKLVYETTGNFFEGKLYGLGTKTFANGNKYVGEFQYGKRNGQGTFTWADGEKYVGEYVGDKPNGQGITYSVNGSIKQSGIYKDGTLVTSQYIDPNSFTRIARNNSAPEVSGSERSAFEQRERQIELEALRLAEERRRLEENKRQRELAKQSSSISITASSTQPDSSGVVTINIQTNTDTSSLKINGEELGGKADGIYSVKKVARVGQDTKLSLIHISEPTRPY